MNKLIEMEQAGIAIYVFGPGYLGSYAKNWNIQAKKIDDGMELNISTSALTLPAAIDDVYERWIKATTGLPNHSLKQIEHRPPFNDPTLDHRLDDEIPF